MTTFTIGALVGKLKLDTADWTRGVTRALGDSGKLKAMLGSIEAKAKAVALAFTGIAIAFAGVATKLLRDAARIQEADNLFSVTFKSMSGEVRAWSEQVADSMGLSASEIRENVAMMNLMITSLGFAKEPAAALSKELAKLVNDIASLRNISLDEAFVKLKSGLSGESEPLKAIGIDIKEAAIQSWAWENGLVAVGKQLNEQEKILARVGTILAATKDDQGDFVNTMDSLSNLWRRLTSQIGAMSSEIGGSLIPRSENYLAYLVGIVEHSRDWIKENGELAGGLLNTATNAGIASAGIAAMATSVYVGAKAFNVLRASALTAWVAVTSPVGLAVAAIAAVIAVLYTVSVVFRDTWRKAAEASSNFVTDFRIATGDMFDPMFEKLNTGLNRIDKFARSAKALLDDSLSYADRARQAFMIGISPDKNFFGEDKDSGILSVFAETLGAGAAGGKTALQAVKDQMAADLAILQGWAAENFPETAAQIKELMELFSAENITGRDRAEFEGYTLDITKDLLKGAKISDFSGQKAAAKEAEDLAEAGERLYLSLVPVEGALAQIRAEYAQLAAAGRLDEAGGVLAADIFNSYKDAGIDAMKEIRDRLAEAGVESSDFLNTFDELIVKFEEGEKKLEQEAKMEDVEGGIVRIGSAIGSLGGSFAVAAKASMVAARIMQVAAAIAKGPWALVEAAVMLVVEALGIMGEKGVKEAEGLGKVIDDIKEKSNQWIDDITDKIVEFARTGKTAWGELVDQIVGDINRIAISELLVSPLVGFLGGLVGFSSGGVFSGGQLVPAKNGHVTNGPELFKFGTGQTGIRGEAGNEAIMPISRTASGKLGVSATGGGGVVVNVHNNTPAKVHVEEGRGPNGEAFLDIVIGAVKEGIARGSLDNDLAVNFGVLR